MGRHTSRLLAVLMTQFQSLDHGGPDTFPGERQCFTEGISLPVRSPTSVTSICIKVRMSQRLVNFLGPWHARIQLGASLHATHCFSRLAFGYDDKQIQAGTGLAQGRQGGSGHSLRATRWLIPNPYPLPYSSYHENLIRSNSFAKPPLDRAAPRLTTQSVLFTAQKGHVVDNDEGAGATSSQID